jgi:hypothetical protein
MFSSFSRVNSSLASTARIEMLRRDPGFGSNKQGRGKRLTGSVLIEIFIGTFSHAVDGWVVDMR